MRRLILFFLTLTASAAFAAPQKGRMFLSWDELSRLSRPQRMAYIRAMSDLIITMEKTQSIYEVAGNGSLEELKEYFAELQGIMNVLPEARAEDEPFSSAPSASPLVPYWNKEKFQKEGIGWDCAGSLVFDAKVGTCVHTRPWSGTSVRVFPEAGYCPKGSQSVPATPASSEGSYCVPDDAMKALPEARRSKIIEGEGNNPEDLQGMGERATRDLVVPAPTQANEARGTTAEPPPPDSRTETRKDKQRKPAEVPCEAPKYVCKDMGDKEKQRLISAFRRNRSADANVCIYGGFFSKYATNKKKAGTCLPINRYPNKGSSAEKTFRCDGKGKLLCNPALFCLGYMSAQDSSKVEGIKRLCEAKGRNATENCEQLYQEALKKRKFKNGDQEVEVEACDPASQIPENFVGPNFRREWDDLVKVMQEKFERWCVGDEGFQALFCKECSVMADKIHKMNGAVKSNLCKAPEPTEAPSEPVKPDTQNQTPGAIKETWDPGAQDI